MNLSAHTINLTRPISHAFYHGIGGFQPKQIWSLGQKELIGLIVHGFGLNWLYPSKHDDDVGDKARCGRLVYPILVNWQNPLKLLTYIHC